jgi:hypothetical protein
MSSVHPNGAADAANGDRDTAVDQALIADDGCWLLMIYNTQWKKAVQFIAMLFSS